MRRPIERRTWTLLCGLVVSSAAISACGGKTPDMVPEAPPDATEMGPAQDTEAQDGAPAPADPEKPDIRDETADALDEGETFKRVDRDQDRRLSRDEVAREGVPVVINTWDADRDGVLAGEEIYAIFFDTLDVDDSGGLSFAELQKSKASADADLSADTFDRSDVNRDRELDRKEARDLVDNEGSAARWDPDADGSMNPGEVLDYVYDTWDSNDDGFLEGTEWLVVP